MKNPFSRFFRARDKPGATDSVSSASTFYFGSSAAGKSVTASTAIQMSTVYACVRVIAETIASLPLHVYQNQGEGSVKALDHPLYPILHDEPNSEMTSFVWRETMIAHLLLWGNAYCQIIRSGRSQILGLYPLLPDRMEVDRDSAGMLTYTYSANGGQTVKLRPENVLHIPGLGFDGVVGYSPIALEKNAIGLGLAAEEYGSKFFSNGARPSGILTHPNTVKDPKKLRDSWNAAYGGSNNSGRAAVLEENMSYTPISMPNSEAQFLETRKFQVSEICRIYRVPPHMVGDLEHATFSNIENQSISFAVHTIRPWVVRLEQAMNRALFSDREIPDRIVVAKAHIELVSLLLYKIFREVMPMSNYKPIIPEKLQSEEEKKLLAERERIDTKLTYHKHRLKALEHEEAQLARKARNHRIFTRGCMLEAFLLKPTLLSDDQVHSLLKIIFHKPEVNEILNRMIEEAEEKIEEDETDGKTL